MFLCILQPMTAQVKGSLYVIAGLFMFSMMSALVKNVSDEVSFAGSVFFRGLVGTAIIYAFAKFKGISVRGNRRSLLFARALSGTIALFLVFYSFVMMPTANAMLLNQTTPIFMVPLAVIFLKEQTSWKHILWVAAALIGVWMVLNPRVDDFNVPGLFALISAVFASIAYLLVRKLHETDNSLAIVFWFTAFSTLAALPFSLEYFWGISFLAVLKLIGIGVLGAVGQIFLTVGYKLGQAGRLSVLGGMGAIFCVFWDFVLLHHLPDLLTILGGVMVILACSIIQILKFGKKQEN